MNRKLSFAIVTGSIVIAGATLNIRLNTQVDNPSVSLKHIEAMTYEYSYVDEEDEIDLHGSVYWMPVKSYSSTPFRATKYSSHITVYYLVNLSNITVQIVKASGQTVYSNTVNPIAGGQLNISLASLP
ncbi:MAG: DUF3244 domain-containing protein, partial [Prevotellaceae bacterium]|nr:DUF3244 domain-containing protein [Prevotellaceae bacterium]